MLKFESKLLENCNKPSNKDSKKSIEMSGGLLCSQHNVCQDHQGEQQQLQLILQLLQLLLLIKVPRLWNVL
jgi:hypothetical protein